MPDSAANVKLKRARRTMSHRPDVVRRVTRRPHRTPPRPVGTRRRHREPRPRCGRAPGDAQPTAGGSHDHAAPRIAQASGRSTSRPKLRRRRPAEEPKDSPESLRFPPRSRDYPQHPGLLPKADPAAWASRRAAEASLSDLLRRWVRQASHRVEFSGQTDGLGYADPLEDLQRLL
jgi:hypothetical protein